MTKKEEIVYRTVKGIIEQREAAHRIPDCAITRELIDELHGQDISRDELSSILQQLCNQYILHMRATVNDQSYYLNNNDHECNS